MDASAVALAQDNDLPVVIFNMHGRGAFGSVVKGEGFIPLFLRRFDMA